MLGGYTSLYPGPHHIGKCNDAQPIGLTVTQGIRKCYIGSSFVRKHNYVNIFWFTILSPVSPQLDKTKQR